MTLMCVVLPCGRSLAWHRDAVLSGIEVGSPKATPWEMLTHAWTSQLAWAVYDGMFAPGPPPEMLGHHNWDRMLAGTLVPLIYHGEMPYAHCDPATITGTDAQRATKLAKKKGLPSYKEQRAHVTSAEA